ANFAIPGQGTSAGTSTPGGLIRANSATNGRGQPYTVYSLNFVDNLSWTKRNHNFKFGGEFRSNRIYTDRLGGTTYVFNNLTDFLANRDRKSTRLNSSHQIISYAVFCLKKKKKNNNTST